MVTGSLVGLKEMKAHVGQGSKVRVFGECPSNRDNSTKENHQICLTIKLMPTCLHLPLLKSPESPRQHCWNKQLPTYLLILKVLHG